VDLIHPHAARDVQAALRDATRDGTRVLVVGGRTHMDKGNPGEVDAELWTTYLDDIVRYDPDEMIATVGSGVRVSQLREVLAEARQEWPIDAPEGSTVGGVIAAGIDPVRRLRVGLVRDSVVETTAVTGDGRLVRSGAPTVKSVTGFDVHRLLVGSFGTLACITTVSLKVRPLPKARRTLVTADGGVELGQRLLDAIPLPAAVLTEPDRVFVRLEGWPEEVREQTHAARLVAVAEVEDDAPFPPPLFPNATIVAEASVTPSRLGELLDGQVAYRASMGVGTAWVACGGPADLAALRETATALDGIAPVLRGPGGLGQAEVPAPQVQRRIKAAFDPAGILAPRRGWDARGDLG